MGIQIDTVDQTDKVVVAIEASATFFETPDTTDQQKAIYRAIASKAYNKGHNDGVEFILDTLSHIPKVKEFTERFRKLQKN